MVIHSPPTEHEFPKHKRKQSTPVEKRSSNKRSTPNPKKAQTTKTTPTQYKVRNLLAAPIFITKKAVPPSGSINIDAATADDLRRSQACGKEFRIERIKT